MRGMATTPEAGGIYWLRDAGQAGGQEALGMGQRHLGRWSAASPLFLFPFLFLPALLPFLLRPLLFLPLLLPFLG